MKNIEVTLKSSHQEITKKVFNSDKLIDAVLELIHSIPKLSIDNKDWQLFIPRYLNTILRAAFIEKYGFAGGSGYATLNGHMSIIEGIYVVANYRDEITIAHKDNFMFNGEYIKTIAVKDLL